MYYFGLFGGMAFAGLVLMYKPDTRYVISTTPPPCSGLGHTNTSLSVPFLLTLLHIDPHHHSNLSTHPSQSFNPTASRPGPWPRRKSVSSPPAKCTSTSPRQTRATPTVSKLSSLDVSSNAQNLETISEPAHACNNEVSPVARMVSKGEDFRDHFQPSTWPGMCDLVQRVRGGLSS